MNERDPESRSRDAELVRRFLAARNAPCPVCHFNLRDLPGDLCPECGTTIRVEIVRPRTPAKGLRALAVLSLAIGAWLYVSEVVRCVSLIRDYGVFFGGQGFAPVNWLSFGAYSLVSVLVSAWLLIAVIRARSSQRRAIAWDRLVFGALAMMTGFWALHLLLSMTDWIRRWW